MESELKCCENCVYEDVPLAESPCSDCDDSSSWKRLQGCSNCAHRDDGIFELPCATCMDHVCWKPMPDVDDTDDTYANKADAGKVDMSLLEYFPNALKEACKVFECGAKKYKRGSFLDVPDAKIRYKAALWRHLLKEGESEDSEMPIDTEFLDKYDVSIGHDAFVLCNALMRLEIRLRGDDYLDDLGFWLK